MATAERTAKINRMMAQRQSGLVVVLQDVHDPHNAAAVLRSCDAFGVQAVYQIFEKEMKYNSKKVGKISSSSANKWVDIHTFESTQECFAELKNQGYQIWVTALEHNSVSIYEADLTSSEKIALVFGNEHSGASEEAIQFADYILEIPMRGMVQSLNISVSAAVCIYEATRQRMPRT